MCFHNKPQSLNFKELCMHSVLEVGVVVLMWLGGESS